MLQGLKDSLNQHRSILSSLLITVQGNQFQKFCLKKWGGLNAEKACCQNTDGWSIC